MSTKLPHVSGFEILEMLQLRSELASVENKLVSKELTGLELADGIFLKNAPLFYSNLAKIVDIQKAREERKVLPSHWWWYLDKLFQKQQAQVAGA